MRPEFSPGDIAALRTALLAFFDAAARPLPWRRTRDPYAVWISEVMSQQTRVETVVPYYERWLSRFPDVDALARAPLDDVLKAWEGLGYYSRARNLHAAAMVLRERHRSAVPDSYDALRALPGVGDYTAGAVASIAFGDRRPAIDGNVRRVLARMLDHPAPPPALLAATADALVPAGRPGDFNQALMELGATICTPRSPKCPRCPIATHCAARAAGTAEDRPAPRRRGAVPVVDVATAVVRDAAGRLLITRRPARGLLARMWCFPGAEMSATDDAASLALDLARRITARTGSRRPFIPAAAVPRPLATIVHTFSHRRERYQCFIVDAADTGVAGDDTAWVDDADMSYALPRAQQRIRSMALTAAHPDSRKTRTTTSG